MFLMVAETGAYEGNSHKHEGKQANSTHTHTKTPTRTLKQNHLACEATVLTTEPLCHISNEHAGMKYLNHYMASRQFQMHEPPPISYVSDIWCAVRSNI